MRAELQGKVVLVTGGTSGIGGDTAILFAKAGAKWWSRAAAKWRGKKPWS